MQPTELYYEPIRADGVVLLKNDNLICHWEFQTNPDKYMVYRMLDYYVRLLGLYPDCQILQTVIYLRETTSELVSCDFYQDAHTTHQFRVIRIWEEEAETLMNLPGLLPEAIGERAMMMKMLNRRLGLDGSSKTLPISLQSQIESLSLSKIDSLAEVLLDFSNLADLEEWLSRQ